VYIVYSVLLSYQVHTPYVSLGKFMRRIGSMTDSFKRLTRRLLVMLRDVNIRSAELAYQLIEFQGFELISTWIFLIDEAQHITNHIAAALK
jgi:hypothetical protein